MSLSLAKIRFLLVDDNVHMLNIVKTILKGVGATYLFEAKTMGEAMEKLKREQIDIVILDYMIGDEDGVTFIHQVRNGETSPAPYVPIIMLTAHADRIRVAAARDAGVTEFCVKPVTAQDMLKKIGAVVDHPRPFVRSAMYFGPDRRRRRDPNYRGPERRKHAPVES